MKTFRNPSDIHAPQGAYTHQVEIQGPERLLVISGQVGARPDGSVPDDVLEQLDLVLEKLARVQVTAPFDGVVVRLGVSVHPQRITLGRRLVGANDFARLLFFGFDLRLFHVGSRS